MKKAISIFLTSLVMLCTTFVGGKAEAQVQLTGNYASFLGVLDTLTNADTTTYTVSIQGVKTQLAIQANVLKISGTVNAKMYIYASVDGTNYSTAAIDSIVCSDASANYVKVLSTVPYQKLRLRWLSTATQSLSQRTYLLYRKQ